ncbi:MAG: transposase [Chloroflexi bacterium]|nr:transposase [Chloroflexota bacterium]
MEPRKHRWRIAGYEALVQRAKKLGLQYAQAKEHGGHPCHALCKRLLRHQDELFQFVLVPGLAAHNNLAERSIRPVVVMRKVSGGTKFGPLPICLRHIKPFAVPRQMRSTQNQLRPQGHPPKPGPHSLPTFVLRASCFVPKPSAPLR